MPEFDDKRLSPPAGHIPTPRQVVVGTCPVLSAPDADAEMVTQALFGETLDLFDTRGPYGHVQFDRDRYVGWVPLDLLSDGIETPTHRLSALRTHTYSRPDLKSPPVRLLSHGARVRVTGQEGCFMDAGRAGWVPEQHLVPIDTLADDPAAIALQFQHAPYLWGGCDSLGLDCTGLTRAAYDACGLTLPRDSDMQFAWAGEPVENWSDRRALRRNDLVFWKGHVGIMLDSDTLLHANAYHMAVAKEPLTGAIERIAKLFGEPIGARRVDISQERGRVPDWLAAKA